MKQIVLAVIVLQSALCNVCMGQPLKWELTGLHARKAHCTPMNFDGAGALAVNARGDLYIAGEKGDAALQVLGIDGSRRTLVDRRDPDIRSGHYTGISLALDSAGSVYLAIKDRGTIEKLGSRGDLTLIAGKPGDLRSTDGAAPHGRFRELVGIAISRDGDIYVIDHKAIRMVSKAGAVSTLAGDIKGNYPEVIGPDLNMRLGIGRKARLVHPSAIAISPQGEIYVADGFDGYLEGKTASVGFIRTVSKQGAVESFAGRYFGDIDDKGSEAGFGYISSISIDGSGNLYLSEHDDNSVRKVDPDADVSTLLSDQQPGDVAPYPWAPNGISATADGVVYVSGTDEGQIYRIKMAKKIEVLCTP